MQASLRRTDLSLSCLVPKCFVPSTQHTLSEQKLLCLPAVSVAPGSELRLKRTFLITEQSSCWWVKACKQVTGMGAEDSAKGERGWPQRYLLGSGGEGKSRGASRQNTRISLGAVPGPECLRMPETSARISSPQKSELVRGWLEPHMHSPNTRPYTKMLAVAGILLNLPPFLSCSSRLPEATVYRSNLPLFSLQ